MWKDKVKLEEGQRLRFRGSVAKGSLGQREVDRYDVVNAADEIVGQVTHTVHTNLKHPFKQTYQVSQTDADGVAIVDERGE